METGGSMSSKTAGDGNAKITELLAMESIAALDARNNSRPQKYYDKMSEKETTRLLETIAAGDLFLLLEIEQGYQNRDLEFLARSPRERENVQQGLKDFERALSNYRTLRDNPERYREAAYGYIDRDRDKKLDVPMDGMRKALASQISRIQNRMALTTTQEEKNVLSSRIALLNAIKEKYARLQVQAVHG